MKSSSEGRWSGAWVMPKVVFIRREDAERLIEEVRGDEPEIAGYPRIAERASEAGG